MADPILTHPDFTNLQTWWQSKLTQGEAVLTSNVIDSLWWQFKLFGSGIVQDIAELDQAIKIVLSTPIGSDIHRPEFSSGIWQYIDYPIPRATPFVVRESTSAVETWEPRVTLDSVTVQKYSPGFRALP